MYYVCIDKQENRVSNILDYEPNVPENIKVVTITDEQYKFIENKTHFFNIEINRVVLVPNEHQALLDQEKIKQEALTLLNESDWKVLRHIREKALEVETTLSEEEYLELEQTRAEAAAKI